MNLVLTAPSSKNGCLLNDFGNDSNERNIKLIKSKRECNINFDHDDGTSYSINVNDKSDKNLNNRSKQHGMNDQLRSELYLSSQNINDKHDCKYQIDSIIMHDGNGKCNDTENIKNIENIHVNDKNRMNKKHKLDNVDEITFSNTVIPRKKRQRLLLSSSNDKNYNSNDSDSNYNDINNVNNHDSIHLLKNYISAVNDQDKNDTSATQSVFVFNYSPVQVSFLHRFFLLCEKFFWFSLFDDKQYLRLSQQHLFHSD